MKKLLVLLFPFALVSCESKLPSNIDSAVYGIELAVDMAHDTDSLILSLNRESIDNLTRDSIMSIIAYNDILQVSYQSADKELKELLKYSPEYSDHSEVKSVKSRYCYKNMQLYYVNLRYMEARASYLFAKEIGYKEEKPVYGE